MAITETDFLTFALSLHGTSEMDYRHAISRLYYAVYHHCLKAYSLQLAQTGENPVELISYLLSSSDVRQRQIVYLLKQLKMLANVADYQLQETITPTDQEMAVQQTKKLIALLESKQ